MPLVDMPLEKLREYTGTNPRPADFDTYWDTALAEMNELNAAVDFIPAQFQTPCAECFDLFFTGVRGARIHAKFIKPRGIKTPAPAILQFHGYSGNSGDWSGLLQHAARGYVVAAIDVRGQGGLSDDAGAVRGPTHHGHIIRGLEDSPQKLLFRDIFLDCAQLAGIVMDMDYVDATRVGAQGGSQGGALTLACAALEPRIKRAAPTFPFLCDYKRVWQMDLAKDAYAELRTFFRHFDPKHEREEAIFERLGYIDIQFLAPRIRAEVLMGVGLMDAVCPPSSQFAAFNKIKSKKHLSIFPDFAHETLPGFNDEVFGFMDGL
ncbi:MAG: acetylxylan esterase [Burkholderiales bacterium]|nr:acetylxylan esterase [Phycisphaerae bacterium]